MAIFHAHTSYVSRSTGSSVCAHAAYISASKINDVRIGNSYDYKNKGSEVLHTALFVPDGLNHFDTPEKIWNYVESFEDRIANDRYGKQKDPELRAKSLDAKERFLSTASTGFKMECALPVELNSDQKIELANRLASALFLSRDLIVQYAIHDKDENPHVHFLSSFRRVVDGELSKRKVYYKSSDIKELRSKYADITNAYAQELGYDFSIDHRSLKDQGIDREPTRHRGWYSSFKMMDESRIYQENLEIGDTNHSLFMKDPEELLKQVIADKTVFSKEDLIKGLEKVVDGEEASLEVLRQRIEGFDVDHIKNRIERFGMFCDKALGCHMAFDVVKKYSKSSPEYKDYLDIRESRNAVAHEILENINQYKWLMAKVGINHETLSLMVRPDIAFHDGFSPFKLQDVPKDLRSGDMLDSLVKAYGESLDQKLVDLFNLTTIGSGVKREPLYMGEGDLKAHQALSTLKQKLSLETQKRSLMDRIRYKPPQKLVDKAIHDQEQINGYQLSDIQVKAIQHLTGESRLLSLEGKAGTGKTTVLRAVAKSYVDAGYRVLGTSFQGAAVGELSRSLGSSGAGCYTLDRLHKTWRHLDKKTIQNREGQLSPHELTSKTVIIVDEAGMAPSRLITPLLERADAVGAKVILVGDPQQLGSIERGSYGRLLMEGSFMMDDIRRQTHEGDRAASLSLSNGYIKDALDHYSDKTHILETSFATKVNLAMDVVDQIKSDIHKSRLSSKTLSPSVINHMVLSFRNSDVKDLNHMIQRGLIEQHLLGSEEIPIFKNLSQKNLNDLKDVRGTNGEKNNLTYQDVADKFQNATGLDREDMREKLTPLIVRPGDKVLFTQNHTFKRSGGDDHTFTVYNGNAGVVRGYDHYDHILTIEREEGDKVDIPLNEYTHFDLGYAITINRSQGKTAKNVYVHLENTNKGSLSQNLVYVALTRHQEKVELYTSKEYLGENHTLSDKIKSASKLTYTDVVGRSPGESNPNLEKIQNLYHAATKAKEIWGEIQGDVRDSKYDLKEHPKLPVFQEMKETRKEISKEVLSDLKSYQTYLSAVSYTEKILERWSGLTEYAARAQDLQMASYRDTALKASTLWKEISKSPASKSSHPEYKDFLQLQHKRNELAYQITSFGIPKTYGASGDMNDREPSLMLISKNEVERLKKHTQQYIEARGTLNTNIFERPKQNLDGFYDRLRSSIDVERFVEKAMSAQKGVGKRSGDAMRFGEKGHLSVDMNTGVWTNFKEGISGSLLGSPTKPGLLSQSEDYRTTSFKDTLSFAKDFVKDPDVQAGIDRLLDQKRLPQKILSVDSELLSRRRAESDEVRKQALASATSKKIEMAKSLAQKSTSIENTPAERYLRQRGINITGDAVTTHNVRYREVLQKGEGTWVKVPSLTAIIRDKHHRVQGIQTTCLTPDGRKDKTQDVPKRTQGILSGGFVLIQKDTGNTNRVILAEGVETALSLREAKIEGEIRAVLGINNFKSQSDLEDKEVIIAADNDQHRDNPNLKETLNQAADKHNAKIIMPETPGYDFNDVLQKEGGDSIRESFGLLGLRTVDTLSKIYELNPDFDINQAQQDILDKTTTVERLHDLYQSAFEDQSKNIYEAFKAEKQAAKTLDDVMSVLERERDYALKAAVNHQDVLKSNDQVVEQLKMYGHNPNFIEDLNMHVNTSIKIGVFSENDVLGVMQTAPDTRYISEALKTVCGDHIMKTINDDLRVIREDGKLTKEDHTYKTDIEYLKSTLADKTVAVYLNDDQKELLQTELSAAQEKHLNQDFGISI